MSDQPSLFSTNEKALDEKEREAEAVRAAATLGERPKLRLVPAPEKLADEQVIVEKVRDNVFEVSTLRDHGTTVAAVFYTRKQLEMLVKRAQAALEL